MSYRARIRKACRLEARRHSGTEALIWALWLISTTSGDMPPVPYLRVA